MDLSSFIMELAGRFPIILSILSVIGAIRLINKPLFAFLRAFVSSTSTLKDDELLDKVEQSKVYKGISFVLDWLFSVKLLGNK